MSYPTQDNQMDPYYGNNNVDAGYPEFSDVHDYPNPYIEIKKDKKKQPNYDNPQGNIPKKKAHKHKKHKKAKYQNETDPNQYQYQQAQLLPPANLYKSEGGHTYVPVPVGKPKLMKVAVPVAKPKIMTVAIPVGKPKLVEIATPNYPKYQTPYYQVQPQPMYAPQPNYQAQPYGYTYPYYAQPQTRPKTAVILPPGYKKDYSPNYSPYGDFDYIYY